MNNSPDCPCNGQTGGKEPGKTVNDAIKRALVKWHLPARFNNLTKLSELGMSDGQLKVLLYSLEGQFKCDLGCPLPLQQYKQMTVIELKTKINETRK